MNPLRISLIQTSLHWQDRHANLQHLDEKLRPVEETDLIVLPEMFSTGFTMQPELMAEEHGGEGLQWMMQKARDKDCTITGSLAVKDGAHYYNRLYWVQPNGGFSWYDKRHLFRMGHEDQHYSPGAGQMTMELKGWKIRPLICYDLRFPVWSRNNAENPYDVLIYVANWPQVRAYPWKQLLIARAIENQCYVVGVNRIGLDGNGMDHCGDSLVLNPRGEIISSLQTNEDKVETVSLNDVYLAEFRKLFPVLRDADRFSIKD